MAVYVGGEDFSIAEFEWLVGARLVSLRKRLVSFVNKIVGAIREPASHTMCIINSSSNKKEYQPHGWLKVFSKYNMLKIVERSKVF